MIISKTVTERVFHLLVHSPNGWPKLKPGPGASCGSLTGMTGAQSLGSAFVAFPCSLGIELKGKWSMPETQAAAKPVEPHQSHRKIFEIHT